METITICGSPRKNGNTDVILREFDKQLSIAEIPKYKNKYFNVAKMNIKPCRSCLKCAKKGRCVLNDDFEKVARKMLESDLIIIGSPVYFSDVSASVKAFIDRTFSLWHNKKLKGKKVILVATCAESGTGHTIDTMRHWVGDQEMQIFATVEGTSEQKGRVLDNEMTLKAIQDTVRSCGGISSKKKSGKKV